MFADYYERKRESTYEDKPMIQKIFALKGEAEAQGLTIKKLFLTLEEYTQVETEIRALAADVNFYKLKDPEVGIANFMGLSFKVINTLREPKHGKIDKAS